MAEFFLFLHMNPSSLGNITPDELTAIKAEYGAWREQFSKVGRKLCNEGGKSIEIHNNEAIVTDGPYTEAKEVIGGVYIIEAADYNEAAEISKSCPHLKFGGRIELRQVDLPPST